MSRRADMVNAEVVEQQRSSLREKEQSLETRRICPIVQEYKTSVR